MQSGRASLRPRHMGPRSARPSTMASTSSATTAGSIRASASTTRRAPTGHERGDRMTFDVAHLEQRLRELSAKHRVTGASLAILDGDQSIETATGLINQETGVEVTTDTLFQIGSITKVFTTTLVMQLVDEGRVELDAPVRTYLPELGLKDPSANEAVTVRHFLTHTSGIEGDRLVDTGRGDDSPERFVPT